LVIGFGNRFTKATTGGIVAGHFNKIDGPGATVLGPEDL
jgi:hypothetical protein